MRNVLPFVVFAVGAMLWSCSSNRAVSPDPRIVSPDPHIRDTTYTRIADMPDDATKLRLLGEYIFAYVGDRTCTAPNQCRVAPLGAKPCGGPLSGLIYSTATADSETVHILVSQYNALNEEINRKYGLISDCALISMPEVGCVDGECAALPKGN